METDTSFVPTILPKITMHLTPLFNTANDKIMGYVRLALTYAATRAWEPLNANAGEPTETRSLQPQIIQAFSQAS